MDLAMQKLHGALKDLERRGDEYIEINARGISAMAAVLGVKDTRSVAFWRSVQTGFNAALVAVAKGEMDIGEVAELLGDSNAGP